MTETVWGIYNTRAHKFQIQHKFAQGAGGIAVPVDDLLDIKTIKAPLTEDTYPDEDKMPPENVAMAFFGIMHGNAPLYHWSVKNNRNFYWIDNAYFFGGHKRSNYRVTKNEEQPTKIFKRPDDRWKRYNLPIHPWKKGGKDIIVCPPSEHMMNFRKSYGWVERTVAILKEHTDRNIIVRVKPPIEHGPLPSVVDALQTAHALVTYHSNVATEAIQYGVPVFVDPIAAASCVGETDFTKIETPVYPEREPWFHHLAYMQFHSTEFESGLAYKCVKDSENLEIL